MRLYISVDMEGIPGTWNNRQEKKDPATVKKAINDHVTDVLEAVLASEESRQITEIVIADAHGDCDSIDYQLTGLDSRISLISGAPRPNYMMPAFNKDYDAVFFLGYHAGSGNIRANMDHTYSNSRVHRLWINEQIMNEALINAAYAGYFNIPVLLISGDQALRKELEDTILSSAEYIETKESIAKYAVKNHSLLKVREVTKEKVNLALKKLPEPQEVYRFPPPVNLRIHFTSTSMADVAALVPYTERLDGRTISFTDNDYRIIFEAITALTTIAQTVDM